MLNGTSLGLTFSEDITDFIAAFTAVFAFLSRRRALEAVISSLEVKDSTIAVPVRWNFIVLSIRVL